MAEFELVYSPNSPYAHKVLVAARELGLRDKIELKGTSVSPFDAVADQIAASVNPLAKIPTLVILGSPPTYIFDSSVIMQYLNTISEPTKKVLPPTDDVSKYEALTLEALADGTSDALLLLRAESIRPAEQQSSEWLNGQASKVKRSLVHFTSLVSSLPGVDYKGTLPLHSIALFCALWYADRRVPTLGWDKWEGIEGSGLREWFEALKERESFKAEEVPL